jgi:cyclopropane fatty-acyl-phospholipid synthase-like methyltransferase
MPLYTNLDRVERGLAALGISPGDGIAPEQVYTLDQWHYHGLDAVDAVARTLALNPTCHVLDVGAGIGGPARYLAHTYGCRVTALELQADLHALGVDLTRRAGLDRRVIHVCGDALTEPLPPGSFDGVLSLLAVLHIPDRPRLFARLARLLRPGGGIYVEDLCERTPFAPHDLADVRRIVCGVTVTSSDAYVADLRSAGFVGVTATDLTPDWAPFATTRLAAWRADHDSYARVHGEAAYAAQELFYATVARLYDSGSLGGIRLIARVP